MIIQMERGDLTGQGEMSFNTYTRCWTQATNSHLMTCESLDRPKARQAGYSLKVFIPIKTQQTDISDLTLALLLTKIA